jgi:hypothetical protein
MIRILYLATLLALVLASPDALAQVTPNSPPDVLIDTLWSSWGSWVPFTGAAIALAVRVWVHLQPAVWGQLPPWAKRVIPLVVSGLLAGSSALLLGASFADALKAAIVTWGTTLLSADALIALLGKAPTQSSG